jgi:hypothetical protein
MTNLSKMICKQLVIFDFPYSEKANNVNLRKLFSYSLKSKSKRDKECFSYVTVFRDKFETALREEFGLKIKIIHFESGTIIENLIVDCDNAQTVKLEKIYSTTEAYRIANLEMEDEKGRNLEPIRGTRVIINGDLFHIIKDNGSDIWKSQNAISDVENILEDILPIPLEKPKLSVV